MSAAPIGLFYGSSTCYTQFTAEKIQKLLGPSVIDIHDIGEVELGRMEDYDFLIFGIPTWDFGELQEDWEDVWDRLDTIAFSGRQVAIYGQGDQVGYPDWFQDAVGYLHSKVLGLGAKTHGQWPNTGYDFSQSQALNEAGTHFVGLALDDENEFELSEARIQQWCTQVLTEFGLADLLPVTSSQGSAEAK